MSAQSTKNLIVEGIVKITAAQQASQQPLAPKDVQKFMRDLSVTLVECVNDVSSAIGPEIGNSEGKKGSIYDQFPNLPRTPALPIEKSVTEDKLYCLFDGKGFTMLARYLRSKYKMEPAQYREYWNLKDDYPMVTRGFKESKSKKAKSQGFGKGSRGRPRKNVSENFAARQSSKLLTAKVKTNPRGRPKGVGNKPKLSGLGRLPQ